ncbi:MAG: DUF935 domain-containing protein [Deltaproteobacteria bacterium]|nr:DUF935 domain-containing protein [Deltaproteobacteria bacterium]
MADLYGPDGRPVRLSDLKNEVVTPAVTEVRQPWTDTAADGITPYRLGQVLHAAIHGDIHDYLTLAEEMEERDGHYRSALATRKMAVAGLEPVVIAASEDKTDVALADEIREIISNPAFGNLEMDLLDALGKGFSVVEIIWSTSAKKFTPVQYIWRDPRHFVYDRETGKELRLRRFGRFEGDPLPPFKFLIHQPNLKAGLPIRGGLARLAAWLYLIKSYDLKDWVQFVEIFGMPLRLGKYQNGATEADKRTLLQAVKDIGVDAAGIIPASMDIVFQEAAKGTGADIYEHLANFADKQISKAVLGQTMTVDDGSSMAQAKVHNDVRMDIVEFDAKHLASTLNLYLVRPFVDLNHGPREIYPRITLPVPKPDDTKTLSDNLAKLVPLGLRVSAAEIRDKLALSDPDEGEELLGVSPQTPALNQAQPHRHGHACPVCSCSSGVALNTAGVSQTDAPDQMDALAEEELAEWEEQMAPMLAPVRVLIENASSYEEILNGLVKIVPEMDLQKLMDALARSGFKARGLGAATDKP